MNTKAPFRISPTTAKTGLPAEWWSTRRTAVTTITSASPWTAKRWPWLLDYHDFQAARGGERLGTEIDFQARYTITDPVVPVEFMSFTVESGVTGSGVG